MLGEAICSTSASRSAAARAWNSASLSPATTLRLRRSVEARYDQCFFVVSPVEYGLPALSEIQMLHILNYVTIALLFACAGMLIWVLLF
jgi:hypothetical protein